MKKKHKKKQTTTISKSRALNLCTRFGKNRASDVFKSDHFKLALLSFTKLLIP